MGVVAWSVSLTKEVVGRMGSGLVGLHEKDHLSPGELFSLGSRNPGKGDLPSISKAPAIKASQR